MKTEETEILYDIGQKVDIEIIRKELNFDKACDEAYQQAVFLFGCDENGYLENVKDSDRASDLVVLEFKLFQIVGSMGGVLYIYGFEAWVGRYED